jgi:hypothetical protein
LTWQAPQGWAPTGYLIQRQALGSTATPVQLTATPIGGATFDDLTGFVTGTSYQYTITALSASPTAFGTAQAQFAPPPPQNVLNLIAQQNGPNVTISWARVPGVSKYMVIGSSPALNRTVPGTQNVLNFQGLTPGSYTWTVGTQYDPGAIQTPATTWPSVRVNVLDPNPVLAEGKLYKEASRPQIYLLLDGNKIHIPTPDALRLMGHTVAEVTTVVDGALINRKLFEFASDTLTPGSLVFPPKASGVVAIGNGKREHYPLSGITGSTRVITQGIDTYVGELRGWLRSWGKLDACGEGDVHYALEVDSEWAVRQGIDLHRLLWVGNMGVQAGYWQNGSSERAVVALPLVVVELNSFTWHDVYLNNEARPADWQFKSDCSDSAHVEVRWLPFDPACGSASGPGCPSGPLEALDEALPEVTKTRGSYVRMVGALITDFPHLEPLSKWEAAALDWAPGVDRWDPKHYARWVEMHPPDLIVPVVRDPSLRLAAMRAMGLVAAPGTCQAAILNLAPDDPRPSPASVVGWEEIVGPETYWPNGQNAQNGSRVTDLGDHLVVNAMVCGNQVSPGRFKAFYRVWWK